MDLSFLFAISDSVVNMTHYPLILNMEWQHAEKVLGGTHYSLNKQQKIAFMSIMIDVRGAGKDG